MDTIDIVSLWVGRVFVWGGVAMTLTFLLAFMCGQTIRLFRKKIMSKSWGKMSEKERREWDRKDEHIFTMVLLLGLIALVILGLGASIGFFYVNYIK